MSKETINFDIKQLIQSHLEEAEKIKNDNIKKSKALQEQRKEILKEIHSMEERFKDI